MTNYGQREMKKVERKLRRQDRWERFTNHWATRTVGYVLGAALVFALIFVVMAIPDLFPELFPKP